MPLSSASLTAQIKVLALALIATALTPSSLLFAEEVVVDQTPYTVEVVSEGLDFPWSLAFLPDGEMLVAQRGGDLRLIRNGQLQPEPIAGGPTVFAKSQGGLMDIALSPEFGTDRTIFISYADGNDQNNATAVYRAVLKDGSLTEGKTIFRADPGKDTPVHYGARMAFASDGTLLLAIGDGFDYREQAQVNSNYLGTIVRIDRDGKPAADNPELGPDALPAIYSSGHRNPQGIVFDWQTGRIWAHEHGPRGGDEINLIKPGSNYGWPIVTAGVDYSGAQISPFDGHLNYAAPLKEWVPSIAPAGLAIYRAAAFKDWDGDLLIAALKSKDLRRIQLQGEQVVAETSLLKELEARIRDVRVGPDGFVYVLTDSKEGKLIRIRPK